MLCKYLNEIYSQHIKSNLIGVEFIYFYPIKDHFLDLWNAVDSIKKHPDFKNDVYFIGNIVYFDVGLDHKNRNELWINCEIIDDLSKKYLIPKYSLEYYLKIIILRYFNNKYYFICYFGSAYKSSIEDFFNKEYLV